ncbi:MAG: aminotransferase class V-fold PLP-dependent enzyme [Pseudomonadota bacterium]
MPYTDSRGPLATRAPDILARDEDFWAAIAQDYEQDPGPLLNLENGYFGRMTRSVQAEYVRQIERVNRGGSRYVRECFDTDELEHIRQTLAAHLGVPADSIALTRGASESLQALIRNYTALQPGDQVLVSDLEYDSVQSAMDWLVGSRGVERVSLAHRHPASAASLLASYRETFDAHPRLKLMALTHVSHRTGLVLPVQAIAAEAAARGIDLILDGAHALGQLDFSLAGLGVPFAGFNLHKWLGAPLTLGFIHIDPRHLARIAPDMGDSRYPADDIRGRAPYGTANIPALLTLPMALQEHLALGGAAVKGARLRYLRDLWVEAVRGCAGIEVLTPDEPGSYCGITSLRFTRHADQRAMAERLRLEQGIFTVVRDTRACGPCIRITPALTTSAVEMQRLAAALLELQ